MVSRELSADAGYFNEENVKLLEDLQLDPFGCG